MNITKVDWCSYRSKSEPEMLVDQVESLFPREWDFTVKDTGRGYLGYEHRASLHILGKRIGEFCTGGEQQRGWSQVTLTGAAIPHLTDPAGSLTAIVDASRGQFKRVDIALTTTDGLTSSDTVLNAYRSGGFDCHGTRPTCLTMRPEDPEDGTTVNIGKRNQPKFVRAYDKGFQMAKELGGSGQRPTEFNGIAASDIFRLELELKLPPENFPGDILTNCDSYFAGAYPYLASTVDVPRSTFSLTSQRQAQLNLDAMLACIRNQYGKALFTALAAHHGDYMAVWDKIVGNKHCQALVEAGAMFADA